MGCGAVQPESPSNVAYPTALETSGTQHERRSAPSVLGGRRGEDRCAVFGTAVIAVGVLLLDWVSSAMPGTGMARYWPLQVLVMDVALVLRVRGFVTRAVAAATIAWLLVTATEQMWKWGLSDPAFVHSRGRERREPPCALDPGTPPINALIYILTFPVARSEGSLLYLVTRGFA
eukprot:gene29817-15638_t